MASESLDSLWGTAAEAMIEVGDEMVEAGEFSVILYPKDNNRLVFVFFRQIYSA